VLQQGVRSITDLMVMPGLINLDFADVRSVMGEMGKAMMGTGEGDGPNRALEAAERAIANPLLDGVSMQGAAGVIISIIGGDDMKLLEVDEAANHIRELVDPNANIIWGSAFNPISMARSACRSWPPASSRAPKWPNRRAPAQPSRRLARSGVPDDGPVAAPEPAPPVQQPEPVPAWTPPVAEAAPEPESPRPHARSQRGTCRARAADVGGRQRRTRARRVRGNRCSPRFGGEASDAPAERATPRVAPGGGGSTLFERMANLSRGSGKAADDEDDGGALNIPRFLGRQNNQSRVRTSRRRNSDGGAPFADLLSPVLRDVDKGAAT
jgi:cell division protein FtsZ